MKRIILYTGGIINLIMGLFHICFWKIFNWPEDLIGISANNSGILQIANIIMIYIILYFSLVSFIIARRGKIDVFAKLFLVCISGFYLIRLFTGYIFFGFSLSELVISVICVVIAAGYLYAGLYKEK